MAVGIALAAGLFVSVVAQADDVVKLQSGETLRGAIVEQTDERLIIEHPVLGRLEIDADEIAEIQPAEEPGDDEGAEEAEAEATPTEDEAPPVEKPSPWNSKFELGFNFSFGNTDSQDGTVAVHSSRKDEKTQLQLDARYFYGATDGDRNTNKFTTGFIHDWFIPESEWSLFVDGRYDYDEFNSWESRLSSHGGVGYQLIDEEDFTFSLRAGAGAVKEFNSERDDIYPEALIGADLVWNIDDRQSLNASTTIYPDLEESGEYRAVAAANWLYKLENANNVSLTIGVYDEYQSDVDPGIEHNDLKVYGGLVFTF